jgi:hypothetical protein
MNTTKTEQSTYCKVCGKEMVKSDFWITNRWKMEDKDFYLNEICNKEDEEHHDFILKKRSKKQQVLDVFSVSQLYIAGLLVFCLTPIILIVGYNVGAMPNLSLLIVFLIWNYAIAPSIITLIQYKLNWKQDGYIGFWKFIFFTDFTN